MTTARRQRGAALMLLLVAAVMGFVTAVFAGLGRWGSATTEKRNANAEVLAQAKAAVIGYIAKEVLDLSENFPGRLPCPESAGTAGTSAEGIAAGNCAPTYASNKSLGRLPWRTLGIDKLVDAAGEPLWYAVSPNWVLTAAGSPTINPGTAGQLSFDGTSGIVAIIFAPGRAISTSPSSTQIAAGCVARNQSRADRSHVAASTADPDFRDYLECDNATASIDASFGVAVADNATNEVINDQAVAITASEVLNALQGPLAERLQRTVAPLLSEFADKWIASNKFMPYAVAFSPPEAALSADSHCGTAALNEGVLPIASSTAVGAPCLTSWSGAAISGDGIQSLGCSAASTTAPVICSFRYYRFTAAALAVLGPLFGSGSLTATASASAPKAAASFRAPIVAGDISVTAGTATISAFSLAPKTTGSADLSFTATVTEANLCSESVLLTLGFGPLLCSTINAVAGWAVVTSQTVTLEYPQLGLPSLAGSMLTTGAKNGAAGPFNLLAPAVGDPHYWFFRNEWYRYSYYAVAPRTSAAQAGAMLTVNQFPTTYGANNDKRFVLTVMGPAVTGQTRSATAALSQYLEGDNAATTASPRVFAYQTFTVSGNDRVATCPFSSGSLICD